MKQIFVICLVILGSKGSEKEWTLFKSKYKKTYLTQTEQTLREDIFEDNLLKVEAHNAKYAQGLVSYKLGINQYADLTTEEFSALFQPISYRKTSTDNSNARHSFVGDIPSSIDWRSYGVVTDIKNQGSCGSCWAFSAAGVIESQVAIKSNKLQSLSEQYLVDCDTAVNAGCVGGVVQYAFDYIKENGITIEDSYPYTGSSNSTCQASSSSVFIDGYVDILYNNETDLKAAVGTVGPVSVAIKADSFQLYEEGIFSDVCNGSLNHAVIAVGYVQNETTGESYWIMKNSWGTNWGENGYFRVQLGDNLCGITTQSCYAVYSSATSAGVNVLFMFVLVKLIICIYK